MALKQRSAAAIVFGLVCLSELSGLSGSSRFSAISLFCVSPAMAANSEQTSAEAKAEFAISQLKAGHPDESVRVIRELLLDMQLALPMDPGFATKTAELYAGTPQSMKDYFNKIIERHNGSADTKAIIESLINNTVPKDYSSQLKTYCKRVQSAMQQLDEFKSVADTEELKYGDPLTTLSAEYVPQQPDTSSGADTLEKLGTTLNELATQAQQMPVGDARPAVALYKLALVANSAQKYKQAENFAQQSIQHTKALTDEIAAFPDTQIALAYSLLKQGNNEEFETLKEEILKHIDNRERLLITLARFCELKHDDGAALKIYKMAIDNRAKQNNSQKPEWQDSYNALLERIK